MGVRVLSVRGDGFLSVWGERCRPGRCGGVPRESRSIEARTPFSGP